MMSTHDYATALPRGNSEMAEAKSNRLTKYFPLLLEALRSADPNPMRPAEAMAWTRAHGEVPAEHLTRLIQNGTRSIFENDVHWARFYLAEARLISKARRGLWSLTPEGRAARLSPQETWDLYVRIRFGREKLHSGYLYQMYAYLRSQEGRGRPWDTSAGLLLHPAIGSQLYEQATIQGHSIIFATVDLGGSSTAIRSELRRILGADAWLPRAGSVSRSTAMS